MKVTVDLPADEMREICKLTGIRKKGPAIRKLVADALMLQRRASLSRKFLTGEWSARLDGFEEGRQRDREKAQSLQEKWHD